MSYFTSLFLCIFWISYNLSCHSSKNVITEIVIQNNNKHYSFLDSTSASKYIAEDTVEGFFEKINNLDVSIQLGRNCNSKKECLSAYKSFLRSEVSDFNQTDKVFLKTVLDSAFTLIQNINPDLVTIPIKLIKIKGLHYGPAVYYTRCHSIVIPQDALIEANFGNLLATILHEISHIISRYHPLYKKDLYNLIGFIPLQKPLIYSDALQERILQNPDGLNQNFFINLINGSKQKKAIPIVLSNVKKLTNNKDGFFSYIKFDLYQLEDHGDYYQVMSNDKGLSILDNKFMSSFFDQIRDNTQYIIHPDEIIAENFMILMLQSDRKQFSVKGNKLLDKILLQLKEY